MYLCKGICVFSSIFHRFLYTTHQDFQMQNIILHLADLPLLSTLSSITLNQLLFTLGVFHTVLLMSTATPSVGMQRNICCWWTEAWFGQLDKLGVFCSKRFQHSSVLQLKEKLIQRERAVRMCCLKSLESDIKCLELSTECQWWFIYSQRCEFRRTMTMD